MQYEVKYSKDFKTKISKFKTCSGLFKALFPIDKFDAFNAF